MGGILSPAASLIPQEVSTFERLMESNPEKMVLARMAKGDTQAMREIFDRHYHDVYSRIYRVVRSKEQSEDLAQEVFLRLWKKREQVQIQGAIGAYLATMAYHEAVGYLRTKTVPISMVPVDQMVEQLSAPEQGDQQVWDVQAKIDEAIGALPPRCRAVFVLSRFEGKSYREIGETLNISVKTVENQMIRALSGLRIALKDLLGLLLMYFL